MARIFQPFQWRETTCLFVSCPCYLIVVSYIQEPVCIWAQSEGSSVLPYGSTLWFPFEPAVLVHKSRYVPVHSFNGQISHTALAYFFPSRRQLVEWEALWWTIGETSWDGISKARVGFLGNLHSALNAASWDLKTFFQGSPVLNRIDIEILWCIQMLIYISSKNKLLQYYTYSLP